MDSGRQRLLRHLAVRVADLGADEAPGQVKPALERIIGGLPLTERRSSVRFFLQVLRREIAARRILVEHVGPLPGEAVSAIVLALSPADGVGLRVETRENRDLLGGLRVSIGDTIYDASLAGRLDALARHAA